MKKPLSLCLLLLLSFSSFAQKDESQIKRLIINVKTGPSHINPSFVLWIEDSIGKFLRTVFVTEMVGKGIYPMAHKVDESWAEGPIYVEGALPIWAHRRGIKNKQQGFTPMPESPVPDAYTGATPVENTRLYLKINTNKLSKFRLFLEVNQSHDFNDFYSEENDDEENLQSVGQPSVVYGKLIDLKNGQKKFKLLPLGYSDPEGKTGDLHKGFDNFDTALWLIEDVEILLR